MEPTRLSCHHNRHVRSKRGCLENRTKFFPYWKLNESEFPNGKIFWRYPASTGKRIAYMCAPRASAPIARS